MKKTILFLQIIILSSWVSINKTNKDVIIEEASFCGPGYYPDYEYYNLFAQEVIDAPSYNPFLLSYNSFYYSSKNTSNLKNENIEDWQKYLNISYDEAYYLVFKSARKDLQSLLNKNTVEDKNLAFVTRKFIKKQKQALLYLSYAKYLEPYMAAISQNEGYYWGEKPVHTVAELDYKKVLSVLKNSWKAEKDKELKLRYGYQIVRLAHYTLNFSDAISYFKEYVESLNYKGIMYYYALDQKGGAERGLGNFIQANYDFFQFFSHTKNLKEQAYNSMMVTQDLDFENILKQVKTEDEKNDIYLILGRKAFNNPISSFEKIIAQSPNAIQAKVLMARAINQLERNILKLNYECYYDCGEQNASKRLPVSTTEDATPFFNQTLDASKKQAENAKVIDKDYWNLTTAYLYFIQKKYDTATSYLAKVATTTSNYESQKNKLEMLIHITEQPKITPEFEEVLMNKYKINFIPTKDELYWNRNGTRDFILDILANRYLIQGDTAKSFLMHNDIKALEYGPDINILNAIEKLFSKKDKSDFENFVVENIVPVDYLQQEPRNRRLQSFNFPEYVAIMKGTIYIRQGKFKRAETELKQVVPYSVSTSEFDGYANIPNTVFGYNQIECFDCPTSTTMVVDYLKDFKFIPRLMDKHNLAKTLIKLEQLARKKNLLAAKASYLLGNFFFNTSIYGYYRHVLTYEVDNYYNEKYRDIQEKLNMTISSKYYFKDYNWYANYTDDFSLPLVYLDKAVLISNDKELTAKALFTAAKCEQGQYYNGWANTTENNTIREKYRDGSINFKEYQIALVNAKNVYNRNYFKKLKEFDNTSFYDKVVSNCMYFSHYVDNY
ncbi:hypothetical protein JBL43_05650 [Aureibaculum sp. A20]|uniref:Tetratricopeptide repeat protein n=1 Tax=Aureibaculum flavum TaxID=2795986 RepID=A0ABS0WP25_9FLAO|nr:hypothetical protein [Aureibaculum flavum]MBJ2173712.1 hypothetical protein [Aureibaculum flavum]